MHAQWADEFLIPADEGKETPIGGKEASPFNGLYASYCHHCDNSGNAPVAMNRFSDLLEQQLKSRGIDTYRHRTNQSRIMQGLKLRNINDTATPTLFTRHSVTTESAPVCVVLA